MLSCKKEESNSYQNNLEATDTAGIYGKWKWIGSQAFLLYGVIPSPDSVITLTIRSDGSYDIGLNGYVSMQGSFKIIQDQYNDTIFYFNNFPQTRYNIGEMAFYRDEELSTFNDTLQLISYPISPEPFVSLFTK